MEESKKIKGLGLAIVVLVLFSLGSTYAYLNLNASNNTASGQGGCFQVSYSGTEINKTAQNRLKSVYTYTETTAISTVTLSKTSDCKVYSEASICLHNNNPQTNDVDKNNNTLFINNESFRYTMTKVTSSGESIEKADYFKSTDRGICEEGDSLIKTVPLTNTATQYKIYVWIDLATSVGRYSEKTFSGYIYAVSNQSSTVK